MPVETLKYAFWSVTSCIRRAATFPHLRVAFPHHCFTGFAILCIQYNHDGFRPGQRSKTVDSPTVRGWFMHWNPWSSNENPALVNIPSHQVPDTRILWEVRAKNHENMGTFVVPTCRMHIWCLPDKIWWFWGMLESTEVFNIRCCGNFQLWSTEVRHGYSFGAKVCATGHPQPLPLDSSPWREDCLNRFKDFITVELWSCDIVALNWATVNSMLC